MNLYLISEIRKSVKPALPSGMSVILTIYEIIKAHGGQLKIETSEGEGTSFIIQLPETSHE